jgi:hypothetical protein
MLCFSFILTFAPDIMICCKTFEVVLNWVMLPVGGFIFTVVFKFGVISAIGLAEMLRLGERSKSYSSI